MLKLFKSIKSFSQTGLTNEIKSKIDEELIKKTKKAMENYKYIDIRVGKVVNISNMEGSDSIYHCLVDVGDSEIREIGCGLRKHNTPISMFLDYQICVFLNIKPKKIGNFLSKGMILSCSNQDQTDFELIRPANGSVIGESVYIEGSEGKSKLEEYISGNKFQKALMQMRSNEEKIITYFDLKLKTNSGYVYVEKYSNSQVI